MINLLTISESPHISFAVRYGGERADISHEQYLKWVVEGDQAGTWADLRCARKFTSVRSAWCYVSNRGLDIEDLDVVPVVQTHSELHYFSARGPVSGPLHVDECPWPVGSYGHSTWKQCTSPIKRVVRQAWRKADDEIVKTLTEWGVL